jgi:hypothetical protein
MRIRPFRTPLRLVIPIALLMVFFLSSISLHASAATPDPVHLPSKLERQVQEWVALLAEQKPFMSWQTADPQIEALGPGTHSWLVLFTKEGKNVGYMVVHAVTDGSFRLGEYGLGPNTLFSHELLKQSLIDNGLISVEQIELIKAFKHYVHPFAAAWKVTVGEESYWLDAKTAELLPIDSSSWHKIISGIKPSDMEPKTGSRIFALKLNESFDPYERLPWLTKEAPFSVKDTKKLLTRLNKKQHLRYVTEPFGEAMLYAVPVIGYQHWSNGRLDMAVDMEGTRYIPLDTMRRKGLFYR